MATLNEILEALKGWGFSWKARAVAAEEQNVALRAGLEAAVATLQAERDADAETDLAQAEQVRADTRAEAAAAAQAVLDEVTASDLPPAPDPEPPVDETPDPEPAPE